jgi:hypothetical protein
MKNGTCNFDVTSHGKNVPGRMLKSGTISMLSIYQTSYGNQVIYVPKNMIRRAFKI